MCIKNVDLIKTNRMIYKKHEGKYTLVPIVTQNRVENYCKNWFLAFFMVKFSSEHFGVIRIVEELYKMHHLYISVFMQILP
mgnify:CR=1 FL=1